MSYSNTSHVKVYHASKHDFSYLLAHSNTSHVKVYLKRRIAKSGAVFGIQIHLMLKFIERHGNSLVMCMQIQIHLMLKFIKNALCPVRHLRYSNTSHVKVYLEKIKINQNEKL